MAMWRGVKLPQRCRQNMGGLEYSEHTRLTACLLIRLRGASSSKCTFDDTVEEGKDFTVPS